MKEFGLSGNYVMCLFYLAQYPEGLTATNLCELISIDKAATSRALSELVEKGYVYYPDLGNHKKYRTPAVLTEKGREMTGKIEDIICNAVDKIGSSITDEEREIMYRSLDKISEGIEDLAKVFCSKGKDD
ncbi:MAG: winged helix-turn-helix transcriptional regulator [Tyzzerella sp.]|nr:winged helix-turn-helix transcriptional regulator [Tyzzerella sp.]